MNFTQEQKQIITTNHSKVVVLASAASGKTATLTARVHFLLEQGIDPSKIVVITFTNMAAEELYSRLKRPKGLFVGTIHAYANYLLLSSGISTREILDKEEFDKLFNRVKENLYCIRPVEHLLLDEAQDSDSLQFEFLLDMVKPHNFMLVGDWRQSIYRWKGSEPELVMNMVQQPDITTYPLTENYRNGASILNYAKRIIAKNGEEYEDYSYAARQVPGQVIEIPFTSQSISNLLLKDRDFGKWFVLTRTNTEIELMMNSFTKNKIPFDTFKKSQLDSNLLLKKLNENTVKLITIHTAKGLEADKVVVIGANFYNVEERCISYVAATRARDLLVWTTKRKGWLKQERWE